MKPLAYLSLSLLVLAMAGCQKPEMEKTAKQETPPPTRIAPQQDDTRCLNLAEQMQKINSESTVESLDQVNAQIKTCLPQLKFEQQKQFLKASNAMYQRFLTVKRTPEQQTAFEDYAFNQSPHPTLQQSYTEKFSPRDQYLLKHQGKVYYELYDGGEGMFSYRRQPQYLAQIFAPYLPTAERIFIEKLASQNQQSPLRDGALTISWDEIAQRAQFWESYVKQYPNSSFIDDARLLLSLYTSFLFKGMNNTPISDTYTGELSIRPDALTVIQQVAKQRDSELAAQSKRFLEFVEMSPAQRNQKIKVQLTAPERLSGQENILTLRQLEKYVQLRDPYANSPRYQYRDCFSDAVCISY